MYEYIIVGVCVLLFVVFLVSKIIDKKIELIENDPREVTRQANILVARIKAGEKVYTTQKRDMYASELEALATPNISVGIEDGPKNRQYVFVYETYDNESIGQFQDLDFKVI